MEMCYDGALVMPSSYAIMDEEEMTYVEGGGTLTVSYNIKVTKNLIKACASAGVGAAVGVIVGSITSKLHWILGVAIGVVTGVITSLVMSYISDTKMSNIKDKTFKGSCSIWSLANTSISVKSTIGW